MRPFLRHAFVLAAFLLALPFIVLSAIGVMRPAEGFCVESKLASLVRGPTAEETAQSFFVSPELSHRSIRFTSSIAWPICTKSRLGEHRFWAGVHDRELTRLGEPNLRTTRQTGTVLRVLTAPSFSRLPIAFRASYNGDRSVGNLSVVWLEDDEAAYVETGSDPLAYDNWKHAPLERQSLRRSLSSQQIAALDSLVHATQQRPLEPMFDGVLIVIEISSAGHRDVRTLTLDRPPFESGQLFCTLVEYSGVPASVLSEGDVDTCGHAS